MSNEIQFTQDSGILLKNIKNGHGLSAIFKVDILDSEADLTLEVPDGKLINKI